MDSGGRAVRAEGWRSEEEYRGRMNAGNIVKRFHRETLEMLAIGILLAGSKEGI